MTPFKTQESPEKKVTVFCFVLFCFGFFLRKNWKSIVSHFQKFSVNFSSTLAKNG